MLKLLTPRAKQLLAAMRSVAAVVPPVQAAVLEAVAKAEAKAKAAVKSPACLSFVQLDQFHKPVLKASP